MSNLSYAVIICGKIGSGKTTLSRNICFLLKAKLVSFGDYIRYVADSMNLENNRINLQNLGLEQIKQHGYSEFVKNVVHHFSENIEGILVIDGVRDKFVYEEIKCMFDRIILIYLDLSKETLFENLFKRDKIDQQSAEDFYNHKIEGGVDELKEYADIIINELQNPISVEALKDIILSKLN